LVKDPADYRWSSHRAYLGLPQDLTVSRETILSQFSHESTRAVAAYQAYINQGMGEGHQEKYYKVIDQRYLGDEGFIARVQKKLGESSIQRKRRLSGSVQEIVKKVSQHLHVDAHALRGPSKTRQLVEARDILSYIVREYTVRQGAELARILDVDPSAVSRGTARIAERLKNESDLASAIERLVGRLSSA
jgi:hypothetical protein